MPLLLNAGALVTMIAPVARPSLADLAARGELVWTQRSYQAGDLAGAWYVLAATNDPAANAAASQEAESAQIFCVRADDATESSAWTPATAEVDGVTIGVLAGRDPRRAVAVRKLLVEALRRIARRAA
jgi:uroporphyrin-III C-methyltransferase/precorrin-2 dehydrogenase/sirohydrochlorin ferrochelatase